MDSSNDAMEMIGDNDDVDDEGGKKRGKNEGKSGRRKKKYF